MRRCSGSTGGPPYVVARAVGSGLRRPGVWLRFGAEVICADANEAAAGSVAAEIGASATTCRLDLLDPASITAAVGAIGAPDILVTTPAVNVRKPIVDYTDDELDRVVDLNLKDHVPAVSVVRRRHGHGGARLDDRLRGRSGALTTEPGQGAYAATKAATVMLFKTLAAELGQRGVHANTIAPGVVETPLTAPIKADAAWCGAYADKSILGRWAQPSEMVGAVVYLASDASSFVTGTTIFVDGGWTAADGRFVPPTSTRWCSDGQHRRRRARRADAGARAHPERLRPAHGLCEQPAADLVAAQLRRLRLDARDRRRGPRPAQRHRRRRRWRWTGPDADVRGPHRRRHRGRGLDGGPIRRRVVDGKLLRPRLGRHEGQLRRCSSATDTLVRQAARSPAASCWPPSSTRRA